MITDKKAREVAKLLGVDLRKLPLKIWKYALNVELEHGTEYSKTNVTNNDIVMTGKIALAHLLEYPDYYQRLKEMEYEAHLYWKNKKKSTVLTKKSQKVGKIKSKKGRSRNIKEKIAMFFKNNPYPSDKQIHMLAEKLNIDKHDFEEHIYALVTDLLNN